MQIQAKSVVAGVTCGCWAVQTRPNRNSVVSTLVFHKRASACPHVGNQSAIL